MISLAVVVVKVVVEVVAVTAVLSNSSKNDIFSSSLFHTTFSDAF